MRWPCKRGKAEDVKAKVADTLERTDEAEAALREAKSTTRKVDRQVDLADRLKEGWARVHERNHLADLFTQDFRRMHG